MDALATVVVDTTFTAVVTFKADKSMTAMEFSTALKPVGSSVKEMKQLTRPVAKSSYEIKLEGVD